MWILEKRRAGLAMAALAALAAGPAACGGTAPRSAAATASTPTASAVPGRLTFFPSGARVKPSTGVATLVAGCSGPLQSETCTFSFALDMTVRNGSASSAGRVKVGTITGTAPGGITGTLTLRLNTAGRRYLKGGALHLDAIGTVTTTARLVTHVDRRITVKSR